LLDSLLQEISDNMTWEDREVLQEVWNGKLPAMFKLAPTDGTGDEDPCYIMLPRMSYLPLATAKVRTHFSAHIPASGSPEMMWFSYNGTPLRWHHPIGLLYDLLVSGSPDHDPALPWQITVHVSQFPADTLLPCHTREHVESVFMSSLKEADQLKHSGKVVSQMQKKDHNQLWLGLTSDKFDQFWAINRKLMEPSSGGTGLEDTFKHIPARFYVGGLDNSGSVNSTILQKLINPGLSLAEVLETLGWSNAKVITQGITPDDNTPILWMSRHLSYPDNFLHIVVIP